MTQSQAADDETLRRVRNNIIEYLEITSSIERQKVEHHVPGETINSWDDSFNDSWFKAYLPPVFSDEERTAMLSFNESLGRICSLLPKPLPTFDQLAANREWQQLCEAAANAAAVFRNRGPSTPS